MTPLVSTGAVEEFKDLKKKSLDAEISEKLQEGNRFHLPPSSGLGGAPTVALVLSKAVDWPVERISLYGRNVGKDFLTYAEDWPYSVLGRSRLQDHQKARVYERLVGAHCAELMLDFNKFKGFEHSSELRPFLERTSRRYMDAVTETSLYRAHNHDIIGSREGQEQVIDANTFRLVSERDARNDEFLKSRVVVKAGEVFTLPDLKTQNKNRLNETVSIIKALEGRAKKQGKIFVMLTLTSPPRFHPSPTTYKPSEGTRNWNYQSAKAGHFYIRDLWNIFKRRLSKRLKFSTQESQNKNNTFGIRVVEPHKDGAAHWHVMFFIDESDIKFLVSTAKNVWSWSEKACDVIVQDKSRADSASAASYLTKYLMKTYAFQIEETTTDRNPDNDQQAYQNTAERVMKWRKACRLRAYQPFGFKTKTLQYRKARSLPSLGTSLLDADLAKFLQNFDDEKVGDELVATMSVGLLAAIRGAQEGLMTINFDSTIKGFMEPSLTDSSFGAFLDWCSEFRFEKVETPIGVRSIVRDERVTLLASHTSLVMDIEDV